MISKILKILVATAGVVVLVTVGLLTTQHIGRLWEAHDGVERKDDLTLLIARVKE